MVESWVFLECIDDFNRDPVGETEKAKKVIAALRSEFPDAHVKVMWIKKGARAWD